MFAPRATRRIETHLSVDVAPPSPTPLWRNRWRAVRATTERFASRHDTQICPNHIKCMKPICSWRATTRHDTGSMRISAKKTQNKVFTLSKWPQMACRRYQKWLSC
ncbi:hypothetical protein EVAR_65103_1 [Eumeta japonica]|uniref:Uncharacterized protein n=1 Tax=Eumeta variegata TaxID=151549 RepID=A0A4C1ZW24_EUMVA|nr:hypothetical protein EVAR_65103_1 [Eumeta japonica]